MEILTGALLCQQTCGRQQGQQPVLHNSEGLFSRHKCVLSSAGGKWGWSADAVRICIDTSTRKYGLSACWLHTPSSSALPAIRTVYASVTRVLQSSHVEETESYDGEKGDLQDYNYTFGWKLNPSQVESISHGQSKTPILVWCHSCLKIPTQLPYSTASWIWSRKLCNIWIQIRLLCWRWTSRSPQQQDIQWLWPDSFSNNNMWSWLGGGAGFLCWGGRENGWKVLGGQVQSQLLEQCCRIVSECILSCEDKTWPPGYSCSAAYSAAECLPFLCAVWADHAVSSEQWQTQMEIQRPQFKHWAAVLDFQLCVLRLVRWVRCGDYHPWNIRLNLCPGVLLWTRWTMRCQTSSSLSF